jgi:protein ImuB
MFACKRMFDLLEGFLIARRGGVQRLILTFRLDHHPEPAVLVLELLRPSDDALHFTTLLRERLNRKQLEAPAEHITLTADQVIPLFERALSLFPDDPQHSDGLPKLLERLHARLGDGALRGLRAVPDHRPECASLTPKLLDEVGGKTAAAPDLSSPRPFWLLATPQALREVGSIPHYEGPLTLLAGPERIESGWWDADAARDYFIAATPEQAQVWIFRDRKAPTGWFLHGFFA